LQSYSQAIASRARIASAASVIEVPFIVFPLATEFYSLPSTLLCVVRQQKAIMSRPDSRSSLGAIRCPTLVLVGNEDALTPVSAAMMIADGIAGSKLKIVQDCGHLSTMEQPGAVTEALRAWITPALAESPPLT
jgi:pimeloyl-ACP methyl ester carboxylesterase